MQEVYKTMEGETGEETQSGVDVVGRQGPG